MITPARRAVVGAGGQFGAPAGIALAALGLPLLTLALDRLRGTLGLESDLSLYLLAVVGVALVGGRLPGVLSAVAAAVLLNWFFTAPLHTLDVARRDNLVALGVFLAVAAAVSTLIDLVTERQAAAAHASARAEALRDAAGRDAGPEPPAAVLARARTALGMDAVVLRRRTVDGWQAVARAGHVPAGTAPAVTAAAGDGVVLAAYGVPHVAADPDVARSYALAARDALERDQLASTDRQRSALLAAVGHDLRTPLSSIKAAVGTLRDEALVLTPEERAELLGAVELDADRLGALVADLLDAGRLAAGAVIARPQAVAGDEVVAAAMAAVDPSARSRVAVAPDGALPMVWADGGLLERVIANLVDNAVRHTAGPVEIQGGRRDGAAVLDVVDHGAGVPALERERLLAARPAGAARAGGGAGLGLWVARGLTEAMGGRLEALGTPGGGLTLRARLPAPPAAGVEG